MSSTGRPRAATTGKTWKIATALVAIFASWLAQAMEQRPLVMRHLTSADTSLPQNTVMTTLRDSQGFVWLGTEDGLVRLDSFDGKQKQRYARSADGRNSLPGNFIWQVVEDQDQDLWIAVRNAGVARWRRATDSFDVFQNVPGNPESLASNAVRTLLVDADGQVWIGTSDAGVDILDPASGKVRHLRHDAASPGSLSSNNVYMLRLDRAGNVWIGTEAGLDRVHKVSNRIERMGADNKGSILRAEVSQLVENADGTFWVGSYDAGLALIDRDGKVLRHERHQSGRADSLVDDDVRALLLDASGNLWVGTADGLDLLEAGNARFLHYRYDAGDITTLRNSYIMSLYQDATGLLWIGTRGGVSRWHPRSWEMGGVRPHWLREQLVMGFAEARGREVWVASLAGLFRYDHVTGNATSIDSVVGRRNALGEASVMSLVEDHEGSLWIGTMTQGLKRLRPDNRLESFQVAPGKPRSLSSPGIMSLAESRTGRIWVGTFGGGANIVDPVSGEIRQLPHTGKPDAVSGANVTAILEDTQGNLWLGTDGDGLTLVGPDGRLLRWFRRDAADPRSLPSDSIYSLALDVAGRVWIATDMGVARAREATVAPAQQHLEVLSLALGRGSDVAYGLAADPRGGVWVSGNAGLVYLDERGQPSRVYHREDGLQGEEFTAGAVRRLSDGRVAFGGTGGFNIFDPQRLSGSRTPPPLLLVGADIAGVPVTGTTPVWLRNGLSLGFRDNIASMDFAVLDFSAPDARLQYRMATLSEQWQDSDGRISLNSLPAGDHVLEVRAASADSPWSEPLSFALHRDQKPWLTPWAWTAYALLIGLAVAWRIRKQQLKFRDIERARDHLEAQVKERTVELVESNRQLAEAARAKSDFLDRMSHELRTPMNGVVGMTELLSRTSLSATQTHLTRTIRASAQILLQIVNDLLDLSKIRAGKVQLEALPVDIGQVLEECTSLFAGAAEKKGLELIVCPPTNARRALRGDPLRVRQVLMNLVGNAVKFTAQGEIVVRADVEEFGQDRAVVKLSVTDTGIGMDEAVIARIFEPFTQADEKTTRQFGGTGLGLAICRELAEIMGGKITVESKAQIGSTFTLHLPMELGEELPAEQALPATSARLCTRRPSLAESLQRHCAGLGITLAWEPQDMEREPAAGEPLLIDAASAEALLVRWLARPESLRTGLVVIATPAEVERLGLRLLLPERAVILKPVHHVAVREALATVLGAPQLVQAAPAPEQESQVLRGHVLLVEDDPVNAAVAEGYLGELGCTSAWVTSAEAGVARAQTEHFDLIFMDLNMSDMDGFAATGHIRQREAAGKRVPIVALTAHDARTYRERVVAAGMDDILSKPYSLEDCRAMLARWIRPVVSAGAPVAGATNPAPVAVVATTTAPPPAAVAVIVAPVISAAVADTVESEPETLSSVDTGAVRSLGRLGSGGPEALYNRLVGLFETSSQPVMVQLDAALKAGDLPKAADLCHRLKSSSANVGAMAFSTALRELEQQCRRGESAAALENHQRIAAAYEPLLATLRSRLMAASA